MWSWPDAPKTKNSPHARMREGLETAVLFELIGQQRIQTDSLCLVDKIACFHFCHFSES